MNTSKTITIFAANGDVRTRININEGAICKYTLGTEDYIVLPFSSGSAVQFRVGDWCDLTDIMKEPNLGGKVAKRYEIVEQPSPTYDPDTHGLKYELRMDAYYMAWRKWLFKYEPKAEAQECTWNLTAPLETHVNVLLRNLQSLGITHDGTAFDCIIGEGLTEAKLVSYDNTNLVDALTAMAEAWECEWWVEHQYIHFGKREQGDAIALALGEQIQQMSRSESSGTYANRLYVFGAARNIPDNYRPTSKDVVVNGVVQKRLMLPEGTPYIDAYRYNNRTRIYIGESGYDTATEMPAGEAVEAVIANDDIYPRTQLTVAEIATYTDTKKDKDGNDVVVDGVKQVETFYCISADNFPFKKDYILDGKELQVKFESGYLNGMTFGATFRTAGEMAGTTKLTRDAFELVASEDYGRKLPDDILKPQVTDKFVVQGWDASKIASLGLVAAAETELLDYGKDYIKKTYVDDGTYNATLMSHWVYADLANRTFAAGQRISLVNPAFFDDARASRVIGYQIKIDLPYDAPEYTIGESVAYSRLGAVESKVDALTMTGAAYGAGSGAGRWPLPTHTIFGNPYNGTQDVEGDAKFDSITANQASIEELQAVIASLDDATIAQLFSEHATIENLTVTKSAHFVELVLDKVKAAGGATIYSPADGFKVEQVERVIPVEHEGAQEPLAITASAWRQYQNYSPAYMVNGNDQDSWSSGAPATTGAWFAFEFPQSVIVSNVVIDCWQASTAALIKTMTMQVSNDGDTWTDVAATITTNDRRVTYTGTASCKMVRFYAKTDINEWIRVREVTFAYTYLTGKDYWHLRWRAMVDDQVTHNMWQEGDQALCATFNKAGSGKDVRNKYYWALVIGVGTETIDDLDWHYIDTDFLNCDPACYPYNPEVGDVVSMLGHQGTDKQRQSAIYISAYNSIDPGLKAPLFAQYENVTDFKLFDSKQLPTMIGKPIQYEQISRATNYIAQNGTKLTGDFFVQAGKSMTDYIDEHTSGTAATTSYIHFAWADSSDGSVNFTKDKALAANRAYMGVCSDNKQSDSALTPSSYAWQRTKGADGADGETPTMVELDAVTEHAQVNASDVLWISLGYRIYEHTGDNKTQVSATESGYRIYFAIDNGNTTSEVSLSLGSTPSISKSYTGYHDMANPPKEIAVLVKKAGQTIMRKVVQVGFMAGSVFQVTEDRINASVVDNGGNLATTTWTGSQITNAVKGLASKSEITQTDSSIRTWVGDTLKGYSTIEQTADSITAAVGDVSARLDNGGFTINANTTISGNVTITDADYGLLFVAQGVTTNTASITARNIGEWELNEMLVNAPSNDSIRIAPDGLLLRNFHNVTAYMGNSGIYFGTWGYSSVGNILRVFGNGVQTYNALWNDYKNKSNSFDAEWKPIGTKHTFIIRNGNTTWNLADYVGTQRVIVDNNDNNYVTINLPSPSSYQGYELEVVNMVMYGGSMGTAKASKARVLTSDGYLIVANGAECQKDSNSKGCTVEGKATFVSDGINWFVI